MTPHRMVLTTAELKGCKVRVVQHPSRGTLVMATDLIVCMGHSPREAVRVLNRLGVPPAERVNLSPALVAQGPYGSAGTIRSRAVFITEAAALGLIDSGRVRPKEAARSRAAGSCDGKEARA